MPHCWACFGPQRVNRKVLHYREVTPLIQGKRQFLQLAALFISPKVCPWSLPELDLCATRGNMSCTGKGTVHCKPQEEWIQLSRAWITDSISAVSLDYSAIPGLDAGHDGRLFVLKRKLLHWSSAIRVCRLSWGPFPSISWQSFPCFFTSVKTWVLY